MYQFLFNELKYQYYRLYPFPLKITFFDWTFVVFVADTASASTSYDMYVLNGNSGVMKRSGMVVDIFNEKQTAPLMAVSIPRFSPASTVKAIQVPCRIFKVKR